MLKSIITYSGLAAALFLVAPSYALDCNACGYDCGSKCTKCTRVLGRRVCGTEPACVTSCRSKQKQCNLTASILSGHFDIVNAKCANAPGRMDLQEKINAAKSLLITGGAFNGMLTPDEIRRVKFRWCNLNNIAGAEINSDAITLSQTLVYLDDNNRGDSVNQLTRLMAHELYHVAQMKGWGYGGFKCRYGSELLAGHGTGRGNAVESPAYHFADNLGQFCKFPAGDFMVEASPKIYYMNGNNHYCLYDTWEHFSCMSPVSANNVGSLRTYKQMPPLMINDGLCKVPPHC